MLTLAICISDRIYINAEGLSEEDEAIFEMVKAQYSDFSVKLSSGEIKSDISITEYVEGVLGGELYSTETYISTYELEQSDILELYKAQAVAARTYVENAARGNGNHKSDGYTVCTKDHCRVYDPDSIDALYFSSCSGNTKNNEDVNTYSYPYLKSVTCAYDLVGKDFGPGVGLCQMGAAGYAKAGYGYVYILRHYYTGVSIVDAYK